MGTQRDAMDVENGLQGHKKSSFLDVDRKLEEGQTETAKNRRNRGGWITTPFIFGCEAAERLAMTGSHANLITYLHNEMHQNNLKAATTLNVFSSVTAMAPLLGAFVADAYLGRYLTITIGSWIYLVGMAVLTLTSVEKRLRPSPCTNAEANVGSCEVASNLQMGMIYISFLLMALGSGGIRPCVAPFGASQFDQTHHEEKKQLKHYFNWYYFTLSAAGLLATTLIVYVQDNVGWGWGFSIPTIIMFLSIFFFLGGTWLYRYSPPQGSPFTRMAQVIIAALRKRKLQVPKESINLYNGNILTKFSKDNIHEHNPKSSIGNTTLIVGEDVNIEAKEDNVAQVDGPHLENQLIVGPEREDFKNGLPLLQHSNQFRFLDKAAIKRDGDIQRMKGSKVNPWKLCAVQQVEELKCILRMVPMWATVIPMVVARSQEHTYFLQQARSMERHLGSFVIPPASLITISLVTVLLWLPFYDRKLVPVLRRLTGNDRGITFLQKIGLGLVLEIVAMVTATLVEHKRRAAARQFGFVDRPQDVIPISVFWLVPQYVIGGLSESFTMIGNLEFFYHMLPEHLTSTGTAFFMTALAIGSGLSSALLNVVQSLTGRAGHPGWLNNNLNKAHLDRFFGFLTVMIALDYVFFLIIARWYNKQENLQQIMTEEISH